MSRACECHACGLIRDLATRTAQLGDLFTARMRTLGEENLALLKRVQKLEELRTTHDQTRKGATDK